MPGMGDSVFNFWWSVPDVGFYLTDALAHPNRPGKRLTTGLPKEKENHGPGKRYAPFDEAKLSGLFKTFAETEPSEAGILAFARRFGYLLDEGKQDVVRIARDSEGSYVAYAEPLSLWQTQIRLMNIAMTLWDAAESGSVKPLRERFVIELERLEVRPGEVVPGPGRVVHYVDGGIQGPEMYLDPEAESLLNPFDWGRLARLYVQYLVNKAMEEHVAPKVLYTPNIDKWVLRLRPANLLGAMWLQLALAIDGEKRYRSCRECGTWFELDPKVNRTSKFYCSNACRTKALRERQAEALRLYKVEGMPVDQIAQRLESDADTVMRWVTPK